MVCPAVTAYVSVNGAWKAANVVTASLNSGGTIKFGPQPTDGTWSWVGPNGFTSNQREVSINNIQVKQAGQYTGTFTTVAGCVKTVTYTITVDGISEEKVPSEENLAIKSYPNPANDKVTLVHIPVDTSITIFDLCGQLLLSKKLKVENEVIDISCLKPGSYFIRVGNKNSKILKLIKK